MNSAPAARRTALTAAGAFALALASAALADAASALTRGAAVYAQYCVLCHGVEGKGNGRAAVMQKVPPADLTVSALSPEHRRNIVRLGGAGVGRSAGMPAWSEVLTEDEIDDVLIYLDALTVRKLGHDADLAGVERP